MFYYVIRNNNAIIKGILGCLEWVVDMELRTVYVYFTSDCTIIVQRGKISTRVVWGISQKC
jgi:hypothetical protein